MTNFKGARRVIGALGAAVALSLGTVALAVPAQAGIINTCAWSHGTGGTTCINASWSGLKTGSGQTWVAHGDGVGGSNICQYRAKIWASAGGFLSSSSRTAGCAPVSGRVDFNTNWTLKDGSVLYGQFDHDGQGWVPGAPGLNVHA